jgi:tetratricopeptide (TPR) repeat protein
VLAAFIEGKLDTAEKAVVARHLADCSECVSVTGEASRFLTEEAEEPADGEGDLPHAGRSPLVMAIAACLALACFAVAMWWFVTSRGDPLLRLREIAANASARSVEPRLAGFPYARFSSPRSEVRKKDPDDPMTAEAEQVAALPGNDARAWHARGVAALLLHEDSEAVRCLDAATRLAPKEAAYWNDLAAAEIARDEGRGDVRLLQAAILAADRSLALAPTFASASFNRALASERLGIRQQAIYGYERALATDPRSRWNDETRTRLRRLLP